MSVPEDITIENISGKYSSIKAFSDDADKALALQGIPWLVRKALGVASVNMILNTHSDVNGIVHIDVSVAAGPKTKTENRVLDWSEIHQDGPSGLTISQARYYTQFEMCGSKEEDRKFLDGRALIDGSPSSWTEDENGRHVQIFTRAADKSWTMEQTWGFETINDVRYHSRRMVVWKGKEVGRVRYIYGYN